MEGSSTETENAAADERTETRFETSRPLEIRQRRKGRGLCRNEHKGCSRDMLERPSYGDGGKSETEAYSTRARASTEMYDCFEQECTPQATDGRCRSKGATFLQPRQMSFLHYGNEDRTQAQPAI